MTAQPAGEENERAVEDDNRAEHHAALFGQTCPIETAIGEPCTRPEGIRQWPGGLPASSRRQLHIMPVALPGMPSGPGQRTIQ